MPDETLPTPETESIQIPGQEAPVPLTVEPTPTGDGAIVETPTEMTTVTVDGKDYQMPASLRADLEFGQYGNSSLAALRKEREAVAAEKRAWEAQRSQAPAPAPMLPASPEIDALMQAAEQEIPGNPATLKLIKTLAERNAHLEQTLTSAERNKNVESFRQTALLPRFPEFADNRLFKQLQNEFDEAVEKGAPNTVDTLFRVADGIREWRLADRQAWLKAGVKVAVPAQPAGVHPPKAVAPTPNPNQATKQYSQADWWENQKKAAQTGEPS